MIVDSGCPRSLMGSKELEKLNWTDYKIEHVKEENFRFGPSKTYPSNKKIKLPVVFGNNELEFDFLLFRVKSQFCWATI